MKVLARQVDPVPLEYADTSSITSEQFDALREFVCVIARVDSPGPVLPHPSDWPPIEEDAGSICSVEEERGKGPVDFRSAAARNHFVLTFPFPYRWSTRTDSPCEFGRCVEHTAPERRDSGMQVVKHHGIDGFVDEEPQAYACASSERLDVDRRSGGLTLD